MGLFNFFKKSISGQRYDMDTLEGINAIPVPAQNYNTGDWKKDRIDYLLQRKATEHKKNGRMDLAIACLRKSNELIDCDPEHFLGQKEYIRLYKYIKSTGDETSANLELEKMKQKHPEYWDKRISNLLRIKEQIARNQQSRNDLVFVATNNSCPICSKYNKIVYSISGKSRRYPKLPTEFTHNGGFCPDCSVGISTYFENLKR